MQGMVSAACGLFYDVGGKVLGLARLWGLGVQVQLRRRTEHLVGQSYGGRLSGEQE